MKVLHTTAFAIAMVFSASALPAHAGILGDIAGAGLKVVGKVAGGGHSNQVQQQAPQQQQQQQQHASAGGGRWDWLGNKGYTDCLKLWASGNFMVPAGSSQAQIDALHDKGRRMCNRNFYPNQAGVDY